MVPMILKTISTALISASAILLAFTMTIPVYARDSNDDMMNFHPFGASSSETIWHDMDTLDEIAYDGSQNNSVALRLIAEVPRHTINSTDLDLTEIPSNNHGYNSKFDAHDLGTTHMLGITASYSGGKARTK